MAYNFIRNVLLEGKKDKLFHLPLPYKPTDLAPVKSKETLDYQADKKKYLQNIWKIINWRTINGVLGQSN